MEKITDFKIENIQNWKIVFVVTSHEDYDMDRVMLVENYPTWDDFLIVTGNHCSCFDFDDIRWEAIQYTKEELKKLMLSWKASYFEIETLFSNLVKIYFGWERE